MSTSADRGVRIADADPQQLLDPRTESKRIFLFRGRDVAVTMNSVKILHAVRSAITAIAELVLMLIVAWAFYGVIPYKYVLI